MDEWSFYISPHENYLFLNENLTISYIFFFFIYNRSIGDSTVKFLFYQYLFFFVTDPDFLFFFCCR